MVTKTLLSKLLLTFIVPLGKTEVLPLRPQQSIHVSDGKVVKVRESLGHILATGSSLGVATITAKQQTLQIYVLKEQDAKTYHVLFDFIKTRMGLRIEIQNNRVFIVGKLLRFSDWQKISEVSQNQSLRWILKAQMTAEIQDKILNATRKTLEDANLPTPSLKTLPQLEAKISKTNPLHESTFQDVLSPLGYQVIEDASALEIDPMVDLKVQMVELKKSSFSKLGIDFPPSYKAQILPGSNFKFAGLPFEVALNALEQDGTAKVIAEPHLSCRSGKEAKFLAGGEFPIKIINFETHDIQWKKHGILLTFKPLADRRGQMNLSLTAEISLLDQSQTVDGIPGILVNRVESSLALRTSQTIALSGLIKQDSGTSTQGLPGLKDIPILGRLFSSQDYREERTDLVVFVTPRVITEDPL